MTAERLLILDFDGTLCLGDGPVLSFAREVAEVAATQPRELLDPLASFLRGDAGTEFDGCADGYSAVGAWARSRGLDTAVISAAFHRGRAEVDAGRIPISTPDGVVNRLAAMSDWRRVLVTNSPLASTLTLADRLGLTPVLDDIFGDAGKPAGLHTLLGADGELDARRWSRIVSIGDIWVNDLAPVHAAGGDTGLIERHAQPHATPTWRAGDVQPLFDQI